MALSKQGKLDSKMNQKNKGCQILFQMMGLETGSGLLLRFHHMIFKFFRYTITVITLESILNYLGANFNLTNSIRLGSQI